MGERIEWQESKKEKNEFYIHQYITNGYYIVCISSSLLSILLLFIFCKKRREKKKKKKKESAHWFIHSSWSFAVANYCSLPFSLSFHFFYAVFAMTFTRFVLFFLFLVFSSLNYYYTLCTHNNIYILHTFFIFSSYNTLGCAFVLLFFFPLN